jgi:hypothetical protein
VKGGWRKVRRLVGEFACILVGALRDDGAFLGRFGSGGDNIWAFITALCSCTDRILRAFVTSGLLAMSNLFDSKARCRGVCNVLSSKISTRFEPPKDRRRTAIEKYRTLA